MFRVALSVSPPWANGHKCSSIIPSSFRLEIHPGLGKLAGQKGAALGFKSRWDTGVGGVGGDACGGGFPVGSMIVAVETIEEGIQAAASLRKGWTGFGTFSDGSFEGTREGGAFHCGGGMGSLRTCHRG